MAVEYSNAISPIRHGFYTPDSRRHPGVEGIEDLAGDAKKLAEGILEATRIRLSPPPVSLPAYPPGFRLCVELLISLEIPPNALVSQERGTTEYNIRMKPNGAGGLAWKLEGEPVGKLEGGPVGQLVIDGGKRAIVTSSGCYSLKFKNDFECQSRELEEQRRLKELLEK